jgi:hypothetical protein
MGRASKLYPATIEQYSKARTTLSPSGVARLKRICIKANPSTNMTVIAKLEITALDAETIGSGRGSGVGFTLVSTSADEVGISCMSYESDFIILPKL